MIKINLDKKFSYIHSHWDPKIIGELNGQQVKLVKFKGQFDWHMHESEDELFMVVKGTFDMQFRDKTITLNKNEMIIVPRGTEHCPNAHEEVQVLLFEPKSILNTGNVRTDKTISNPEKL